MDNSFFSSQEVDFWKIQDPRNIVTVKWSHVIEDDYWQLALNYYTCGYSIINEVIKSGHDNDKSDSWFLPGLFLLRQSLELGIKALLCRVYLKKNDIQSLFTNYCHNLLELSNRYFCVGTEDYLSNEEHDWLTVYLEDLEDIDEKSDAFRFPFKDTFLAKYKDCILDNVEVANNLIQAFFLVKKCVNKGRVNEGEEFKPCRKPCFFVFVSHGIGNCYLYQEVSNGGFYQKINGYHSCIEFLFNDMSTTVDCRMYPLMFMYRNTIELCLKDLLFKAININCGVTRYVFDSKRKSHLIKKDLWKNIEPMISKYAEDFGHETGDVEVAEKMIETISAMDKRGDMFRYPVSYSFEYRFDNKTIDYLNVHQYHMSLIDFLIGCIDWIEADEENKRIAEEELQREYQWEIVEP